VHVLVAYTTAAIVLFPLPLLVGASYGGYGPQTYVYMALLGLVPQLVGHTSLNWAVRWLSPTVVTLASLGEPIGASALGYLLFRENPGPSVLLGGIFALIGVGVAATQRPKAQ
jgi:drug/metabolite transporter (DMT)-like permease